MLRSKQLQSSQLEICLNIHSVLAVGTSGPVFHGRYKRRTSTVQLLNRLLTPVLVVPLAFARMCAPD